MSELTFQILRNLSDGKFHSGQALAQQFKVSRATVWAAVQAAESLGVTIFAVRGRGYQLSQAAHLLDVAEIKRLLPSNFDMNIVMLDTVESTNTYCMQRLRELPHATCVAANVQTAGRGRRGRAWVSQLGASLTFSLVWRFDCGAAALSGLSLAVGLGIARGLQQFGVDAQLKWPNDILINHQKLAGVLIELQGDMDGPSHAVIGVGLNVRLNANLQANIDQPATDLAQQRLEIDPNLLLSLLLQHLQTVLQQFTDNGFASLRDEWQSFHAHQHQTVQLLQANGTSQAGQCMGVTDDGTLLLQTLAGMQKFASGEVSLRGLN
jgi:BirA family transcriptional regulator, biotin operon repressor / biotin---[acetyl-CoA-carboxylase] ligase